MDQQSPSPSSVPTAFVEQFLEREKEDARRWLRREMDTLVDSLFGQLRCKFVNCLTQRASLNSSTNSGHHNQYESNYHHHHMNYQNNNNSEVQLLGSSNYHQFGHQNPQFHHSAPNSSYNGAIGSNGFNGYNNHQYHHVPMPTIKQEILEEDVLELGPISNSSQFYQNQNPHQIPHQNPPMNQPTNNSSLIPLDSYDRFMSSVQQALGLSSESKSSTPMVPSTPTSIPNSCSLPPTPILTSPSPSQLSGTSQSVVPQSSTQNTQLQNLKTYKLDDLEDYDCKSCINNLGPYSHNTQGSSSHQTSSSLTPNTTTPDSFLDQNESSNTTQLLDYDNESLDTKPLKRLRIQEEEEKPENPEDPQEEQDHNPDDEAQLPFVDVDEDVDSQQGILITLSLKCLQEECPVMFLNKYDLNHHMFEEHGILSNRCQLRGCGQSFGNNLELNDHIHVAHALITEWHCPKCPKSYKKYIFLYSHMLMSHQEGRFKCAFKDCPFVSENRRQVYIHHNQHQAFGCAFPTCNKTFTQKVNLKAHERTHLKIKPYRCKWPKCRYATERYSSAVNHIRGKHFNLPPTKKEQNERNIVDTRDPKDFLLIVSELLN